MLSRRRERARRSSHALSLRAHELPSVPARRTEVRVLVRLRALLAPAHLALVESVAGGDGVLVGRHRDDLALLEHGAPHRLLRLLATRRRVDHLLRLQQQLVHRRAPAHPVHVVRVYRHLLRVDELVDERLAIRRRSVRD